jgi:formate dehydrogenase subunit gamma
MSMKRLKVMRHHATFRFLHWLIFAEGTLLTLTGLQMGGILELGLFSDASSWIHLLSGLAFIATAASLVYYLLVTGEYGWYGLRRIPYSFRYLIAETKAWFGLGPHVNEPIRVDRLTERYVEKVIPTVVMVWWVYVILGLALSLTGLAMAFPNQFWFVYLLADPVGLVFTGVNGYSFMVAAHRLTALLLLSVVAMHAYASFVFRLLRSITFGDRNEIVAG